VSAIEWVAIPAGEFWMGSEDADVDERPEHRVHVPAFSMARTPVTNAQYFEFVRATGHAAPSHWMGDTPPSHLVAHPVTYVDWYDANAFAEWASGRLLTEAEWERAARGTDKRVYVWGDVLPDATRANFNGHIRTTSPVGQYPAGASVEGLLDLAGNVWEWVSSVYAPYPYHVDDGREDFDSDDLRVVRGGSYIHPASEIRCAYRHGFYAGACDPYIGFRIVKND
jgi:formylglycine-generating enzyme required for sulfatase activity